jgi:hypothetical protein
MDGWMDGVNALHSLHGADVVVCCLLWLVDLAHHWDAPHTKLTKAQRHSGPGGIFSPVTWPLTRPSRTLPGCGVSPPAGARETRGRPRPPGR